MDITTERLNELIDNGVLLAETGQKERARELFKKAVKLDPDSAFAWYYLGAVIDDPEKKRYCFSRAAKLDACIHQKILAAHTKKVSVSQSGDHLLPPPASYLSGALGDQRMNASAIDSPAGKSFADKPQIDPGQKTSDNQSIEIQSIQKERKKHRLITLQIVLGFCFVLIMAIAVIWFVSGKKDSTNSVYPFGLQSLLPPDGITTPSPGMVVTPTPQESHVQNSDEKSGQTAALDSTDINQTIELEQKLDQAIVSNYQKDYGAAIEYLNEVISGQPQNPEAYYERGKALVALSASLHNQAEFNNTMTKALGDYDKAIALQPLKGDYYIRRGGLLSQIGENAEYRVERLPIFYSAIENIQQGLKLGTMVGDAYEILAHLYTLSGQCDKGLTLNQKIMQESSNDPAQLADSHARISLAYLCLGQYQFALDEIEKAASIYPDFHPYQYQKAKILYSLGNKNQALEILDRIIDERPDYSGHRYYLRALIKYDQGKYEQAKSDLITGSGNTFWHGDIFPYLFGKLAKMNGDEISYRQYLQAAEASLQSFESPMIVDRIRRDLASSGAGTIEPEISFLVNPTPMPSLLAPAATPDPVNIPLPAGYGEIPIGQAEKKEVRYDTGIGNQIFPPNSLVLYHFVYGEPLVIRRTTHLVFQLKSHQKIEPPLEVFLWNSSGQWIRIESSLGENMIEPASQFIDKYGDFFVVIRNPGDDEITIDNAGFTVTAILSGGMIITFGLDQ